MVAFCGRLSRWCGAIGVVLVSLSTGAGTAGAQACIQGDYGYVSGYQGKVAADGVIEFTYWVTPSGTPGGLSDMIHYAIVEAVSRWNAYSEQTNIRFVPGSSAATSDLRFQLDSFNFDPCARISDYGDVIYITQELWNIAGEHGYGYEWAVATVDHELAHFLRVDESGNDWSTIMGNPQGATCDEMRDNWQAANAPTTISPGLATTALQCFDDFRETHWDHGVPDWESAYYEFEQQPCGFYVIEFWDYWWCIDGECTPWYTTWYYLGCF